MPYLPVRPFNQFPNRLEYFVVLLQRSPKLVLEPILPFLIPAASLALALMQRLLFDEAPCNVPHQTGVLHTQMSPHLSHEIDENEEFQKWLLRRREILPITIYPESILVRA